MQPRPRDLKSISFEDFVSLIFERGKSDPGPTFDDLDAEFDPTKLLGYYVRLFREPEFLFSSFTKEKLEAGFWAMMGLTHPWSLGNLLHYSDAPLPNRKECIESMAVLFERLFVKESLDTSVYMWWDSMCFDWDCGNRNRDRGGEDLELQDTLFQTLTKVLRLDSLICQTAALHGLGHLHHPDTEALIGEFIKTHPSLTQDQIAYAQAAARFQVL